VVEIATLTCVVLFLPFSIVSWSSSILDVVLRDGLPFARWNTSTNRPGLEFLTVTSSVIFFGVHRLFSEYFYVINTNSL